MDNILSMLASGAASAPSAYSPALERQARAQGFRNAEEMMLWARQRNQQQGGTVPQAAPSKAPSVQAATAWHPSNILSYILQKWQGATKD